MAATLQELGLFDRSSGKAPAAEPVPTTESDIAPESDTESETVTSSGPSAMAIGLGTMAVSILAVQGLTMLMMLVLTDVSVLAAFGLGLYCAFWLGIGFGTIFGSAMVFGREH